MNNIWYLFPYFTYLIIVLGLGTVILSTFYYKKNAFKLLTHLLILMSIACLMVFLILLWIDLERPPMRTLGETRLWYALFMPIVGFIVLIRWKYLWFTIYCLLIGDLFLLLNLLHPEMYDKSMMPALQSIWFIPHVIVYIISYSFLGASTLAAIVGLIRFYAKKETFLFHILANNLVYLGFSFLTLGLSFGALWAKEAWGHYWTWDPKETWALITWLAYLVYIHLQIRYKKNNIIGFWVLSISFAILLLCWFGIQYLPAAQNSVHIYN